MKDQNYMDHRAAVADLLNRRIHLDDRRDVELLLDAVRSDGKGGARLYRHSPKRSAAKALGDSQLSVYEVIVRLENRLLELNQCDTGKRTAAAVGAAHDALFDDAPITISGPQDAEIAVLLRGVPMRG